MALIPIYHVVPSYYDLDPNINLTSTPIKMGMFVAIDKNSGGVVIADGTNPEKQAIGVAGDSAGASDSYAPYAADLIINSSGATRSTQNRISDYFNEASGSNKVTVYHSGGEFLTDQYDTTKTYTMGSILYVNASGLGSNTGSQAVGRIITQPSAYPSGVPGTDVAGSISLGNYLRFKLDL